MKYPVDGKLRAPEADRLLSTLESSPFYLEILQTRLLLVSSWSTSAIIMSDFGTGALPLLLWQPVECQEIVGIYSSIDVRYHCSQQSFGTKLYSHRVIGYEPGRHLLPSLPDQFLY